MDKLGNTGRIARPLVAIIIVVCLSIVCIRTVYNPGNIREFNFQQRVETAYKSTVFDVTIEDNWPDVLKQQTLQPWVHQTSPEVYKEVAMYASARRLPDVICIGVKKCGTSALKYFLAAHPKFKQATKEAHFFDNRYHQGFEYYRSIMPKSTEDDVVFEKSPSYFFSPFVPSRIKKWKPDIKIIAVLCDPVARALSDYNYISPANVRRKIMVSKFESFEDHVDSALGDMAVIQKDPLETLGYATFESFVRNAHNERTFQLTILTHGMYVYHLKDWYTFFNPNQIHIIDGEQLIKNPASALHDVQKFMGLDIALKAENFTYVEEKGFYCITNRGCMGGLKGNTRKASGPGMSPDVRRKLEKFYEPFNKELTKLLKRTFSWAK